MSTTICLFIIYILFVTLALLFKQMHFLKFNVSLLYVAFADEIRLVDLDPNEAANLIEKQDQSLKYAPLVEPNVPAVRFIGNEPKQVVEDVYKANQYHGQDGLGAYIYGYSVPDIAKTEKKSRQGDVRGAYNYIAGDGQEIKIEYWDDGTGFHQIDNIPKVPLVQIDDTPEVKAARAEHERLWKEIAERNSQLPQDPYANTNQQPQQHYQGQATSQYNQPQAYQQPQQQAYQQPQQQAYQAPQQQFQAPPKAPQAYQAPQQQFQAPPQPQSFQAQFPSQPKPGVPQPQPYQAPKPAFQQQSYQAPPQPQSFQAQFPKPQSYQAPQAQPQTFQNKPVQPQPYQAQASSFPQSQQQNYQPQPTHNANAKAGSEEEENGPPKGFFYNFDYNVGIIKKPGEERSQHQKRSNDPKSIFEDNKKFFEQNYGASSQPQGAFPSYNYQG